MIVFTIGFTRTSARRFFGTLGDAGVRRVIDVRLNNVSQLAGFAKRDDLAYFLEAIAGIAYEHRPELAPTQAMLDDYRHGRTDWPTYAARFTDLIRARAIERTLSPAVFDGGCLLCSEHGPEFCHRRLIVEYLQAHWSHLRVVHLE